MRALFNVTCAAAAMAGVFAASTMPASAACTRLGFSVNDYGKDGPTNDAKDLLDKYIAKKMAERGVKTYRTGKKDISCELFLNFIVFDEHTCRADATVCWDDTPLPKGEETAASGAAPAAKKPATKSAAAPVKATTTGSIEKPAAAAPETPAVVEAAPPAAAPAAEETAPATAPAEAASPGDAPPAEAVAP